MVIELSTGEIKRRGFLAAKQVCAVQDGAAWIQSLIAAHRADAVRILDFYHAASSLSDIATLFTNAGTPLAENWLDEQLHELKHHGPANVLEEVAQLLKDHPEGRSWLVLPKENSSLPLLAPRPLVILAVLLRPILGGGTPVQKNDVHPDAHYYSGVRKSRAIHHPRDLSHHRGTDSSIFLITAVMSNGTDVIMQKT
jgi:hypothetical protein